MPLLDLRRITKRFGAVQALDAVDFALEPGEIHALLGENGAGKSTLMRIAFGMIRPDDGSILVDGVERRLADPTDARRLGIGMVHQHFTAIPAFTVAENVALAAGWSPGPRRLAARVRDLARRTGLALEPELPTAELSAGLKQRLEVLKALAADARVLLLDEPSSVLPPADADALLALVRELRGRGVSAVLITHKLREALAVADRVTVLRRGRVVHTGPVAGATADGLATHMLGEAPPAPALRVSREAGEVRVRAERLAVPRAGGSGSDLRGATLTVRAGEVVGVAAVEGNGQRELLRAIAGLLGPGGGSLQVQDPVVLIPEDRSSEGLIPEFTLTENLVLAHGRPAPWINGPWVDWDHAGRRTGELMEAYGVRASGALARAESLSGGNQQRLVLAAALERRPAVLVAENPTRGLDLRATAEMHRRLREAAANGVAVLVHLADLDELLAVADRIVVVANGVATELPPGATREEVGRGMLGTRVSGER